MTPKKGTAVRNARKLCEATRRNRIGNQIAAIEAILKSKDILKKKLCQIEILDVVVQFLKDSDSFKATYTGVEVLNQTIKNLEERCEYYARLLDESGICKTRQWVKNVQCRDVEVQTDELKQTNPLILIVNANSHLSNTKKIPSLARILPKSLQQKSDNIESSTREDEVPILVNIGSEEPDQSLQVERNTSYVEEATLRKTKLMESSMQTDSSLSISNKADRSTSPILISNTIKRIDAGTSPLHSIDIGRTKKKKTKTDETVSTSSLKNAPMKNACAVMLRVEDILQPDSLGLLTVATAPKRSEPHAHATPQHQRQYASISNNNAYESQQDQWSDYLPNFGPTSRNPSIVANNQYQSINNAVAQNQSGYQQFTIDALQNRANSKKRPSVAPYIVSASNAYDTTLYYGNSRSYNVNYDQQKTTCKDPSTSASAYTMGYQYNHWYNNQSESQQYPTTYQNASDDYASKRLAAARKTTPSFQIESMVVATTTSSNTDSARSNKTQLFYPTSNSTTYSNYANTTTDDQMYDWSAFEPNNSNGNSNCWSKVAHSASWNANATLPNFGQTLPASNSNVQDQGHTFMPSFNFSAGNVG